MRMCIPTIGDEIELIKDWTFTLYTESRNDKFWEKNTQWGRDFQQAQQDYAEAQGCESWRDLYDKTDKGAYSYGGGLKRVAGLTYWEHFQEFQETAPKKSECDYTLPAGTILKIDRIYIRKGKSEFDSITFVIKKHPDDKRGALIRGRFWAKLPEVNGIHFQIPDGDD